MKKNNGKDQWEKVGKERPGLIVDALMSDKYCTWTKNRDFLGAHLMNDPILKLPSKVKEKNAASDVSSDKTDCDISASDEGVEKINCCIRPLLDVVTVRNIAINDELAINYNCG